MLRSLLPLAALLKGAVDLLYLLSFIDQGTIDPGARSHFLLEVSVLDPLGPFGKLAAPC